MENQFLGCQECSGYHAFNNEKCPVCNLCFAYCARDMGCKWSNDVPEPVAKPVEASTAKAEAKAQVVANQNIQEAFECWVVSSEHVQINCDVDSAYQEFDKFLKEILTPADPEREYFSLTEVDGDIKFRRLNASKLMKNDSGEYVIVEGRKRTRIGKNVAVL